MNTHSRDSGWARVILLVTPFLILLSAAFVGRYVFAGPGQGAKAGAIEFEGRTRSYFVHVPPGYDGKKTLALVFVLHGGGQSPEAAERMSGMSEEADRGHFLAVYPSGTGRFSRMPTWNSGNCCTYAMRNHVNDVGFFRALIERLERDYAVDPKRVYVTGISNGGMMSYRLGCELADKIAAIAPVEGAQNVECHPAAPVSVIVFHGTADRLVPFDGGATIFHIGPARTDNSVANAVSFWVKEDGCSPNPRQEEIPGARVSKYSGCKNNAAVTLCVIEGGRHAWPGTWISGNRLPASAMIWSFFAERPKI